MPPAESRPDPYDADRPLRLGCGCGADHAAADHPPGVPSTPSSTRDVLGSA